MPTTSGEHGEGGVADGEGYWCMRHRYGHAPRPWRPTTTVVGEESVACVKVRVPVMPLWLNTAATEREPVEDMSLNRE